jgi:NAD(P)-dependent dehydrogenase (short-subunit alcohol dehydrogenase family)
MPKQEAVKIALITGGSAGIGQGAALRLAERGAGIILTYRTHPEGAQEVVSRIEQSGGKAVALPLDLGRSGTFAEFTSRVRTELHDRWGRTTFDHLVNNAGLARMAMFEETTEEVFDELHRVLLKGPYFLTQHLLPLLADGGAIVNTSSNSAMASGRTAGYSAYASMKAALIVLTQYMAKEFSPRRIRVNSVAPGPTRTRLADDAFEKYPELIPPIIARTALGRLAESDDVGRVIAALLSDDMAWVTGENIEASGGFNL